jgi:hypothetical protein
MALEAPAPDLPGAGSKCKGCELGKEVRTKLGTNA